MPQSLSSGRYYSPHDSQPQRFLEERRREQSRDRRDRGRRAEVEAQTGPRVVGPGDVPVTLMVNGKRLELRIEPRVTLLDAMRNRADLTGNKRVCDRGACGACTMIVDGRTVYSCSTLAIEVQGKQIRTVDGLADRQPRCTRCSRRSATSTRLMCGFCTPGFVMATVALLEKHPNADTASRCARASTATSAAAARSSASWKRRMKAKAKGVAPWLTSVS